MLACKILQTFDSQVENRHDCDELNPMPEEKWTFVDKGKKKVRIKLNGVPQARITQMYDMCEEKRNMKIFGGKQRLEVDGNGFLAKTTKARKNAHGST